MRGVIAVCGAIALLAGCASSSKTYGPNGEVAYNLNCSGTARNWGMCLEKAGNICGARGYNVITSNGESGFIASGYSSGMNSNFIGGTTTTRSMVIACKA
jgi:hypothetical protein